MTHIYIYISVSWLDTSTTITSGVVKHSFMDLKPINSNQIISM